MSILLNFIVGFFISVTIFVCIGDPDAILTTNFRHPFMEMFLQATHFIQGSTTIVSTVITAVLGFLSVAWPQLLEC